MNESQEGLPKVEADQEFFADKATDSLAKEISFNTLTQTTYKARMESSESESSETSSENEVQQPALESPLASPKPEAKLEASAFKELEEGSSVRADTGIRY